MNQHYWDRYLKFIEWCDSQDYSNQEYLEKHHIMPKAFKGDNSKNNLIKLPFRAHLIAHLLLAKAVDCFATKNAVASMAMNKNGKRVYKSWELEQIRIAAVEKNIEYNNRPDVKEKHIKRQKLSWENNYEFRCNCLPKGLNHHNADTAVYCLINKNHNIIIGVRSDLVREHNVANMKQLVYNKRVTSNGWKLNACQLTCKCKLT